MSLQRRGRSELTASLASLQDRGYRVALVTDGRMSGASGTVPAAIHVTPEAATGGPLARVRDGDPVRIDSYTGELMAHVDPALWHAREPARIDLSPNEQGDGRELFRLFRLNAAGAEQGGGV